MAKNTKVKYDKKNVYFQKSSGKLLLHVSGDEFETERGNIYPVLREDVRIATEKEVKERLSVLLREALASSIREKYYSDLATI